MQFLWVALGEVPPFVCEQPMTNTAPRLERNTEILYGYLFSQAKGLATCYASIIIIKKKLRQEGQFLVNSQRDVVPLNIKFW